MIKRAITGVGFIAVVGGFFFLRTVHLAYFQILILLFAVIGTWEVSRATGSAMIVPQRIIALVSAALTVAMGWFFGAEGGLCALVLGIALQLSVAVFCNSAVSLEGIGLSMLATVYPSALLLPVTAINALSEYSTVALLMAFTVSVFADTFAFLVGSLLKGPKLCPNVSPKKTVSGAIGGVIGGAVGALVIYFAYGVAFSKPVPPLWFVLAVGGAAAIFTAFGDLVESIIKRKAGIKDMGKILPGHGGIMDRIDGIIFASPLVYACFRLLLLFL